MTDSPDPVAGLSAYLVVASASMGMVGLAAVVTFAGPPGTPIVGFVLSLIAFGTLAGGCLYRYTRTVRFRRSALRDGTPVNGVILGFGSAFNVFSSNRSRTLVVGYRAAGSERRCTIRLPNGTPSQQYPPGSWLPGWLHPSGEAWFPLR